MLDPQAILARADFVVKMMHPFAADPSADPAIVATVHALCEAFTAALAPLAEAVAAGLTPPATEGA